MTFATVFWMRQLTFFWPSLNSMVSKLLFHSIYKFFIGIYLIVYLLKCAIKNLTLLHSKYIFTLSPFIVENMYFNCIYRRNWNRVIVNKSYPAKGILLDLSKWVALCNLHSTCTSQVIFYYWIVSTAQRN